MTPKARNGTIDTTALLQMISAIILGLATLALAAATLAGALGYLPYLSLSLTFGDTVLPDAGLYVQIALTFILVAILAALPSGFRVTRLERTHRDFRISMSDVMEAYYAAHRADREGVFNLASEFDAVKERIQFLHQHPDLGHLEPDILEAAAEMSFASRELAQTYSDENVSRAKGFLKHRQEEIELFAERIDRALTISYELKRQREEIEIEEDAMESRLAHMEEEFGDLLEELGFSRSRTPRENVIALPHATAAE
ncbi:DNA repair protein [Palleronia sediminis]|uniref:DNA repair protein n=1 Tax=Palleronia sediminis TaxID=2547833 RepID=A0A4R6AJ27_9RHOB|nr:DNA repair protein [Palleronia sediminis]TDL84221.1 DNA repair protein [Palleronia sediminis]